MEEGQDQADDLQQKVVCKGRRTNTSPPTCAIVLFVIQQPALEFQKRVPGSEGSGADGREPTVGQGEVEQQQVEDEGQEDGYPEVDHCQGWK